MSNANPHFHMNKAHIFRTRKFKKRYGITRHKFSTGFHFGLRSWYIFNDSPFWNVHDIRDDRGYETAAVFGKRTVDKLRP